MALQRNSTRVAAPDISVRRGNDVSTNSCALMTGGAQSSSGDGVTQMRHYIGADKPDLRRRYRLATWNVMTLSEVGYQVSLTRELARMDVSIAGITESRIPGSDMRKIEDALMLHSGGEYRTNGVALVLRAPFDKALLSWQPISDRILLARIVHRHGHLTILVTYAPTNVANDDTKDRFYDQLAAVVQTVPPHDQLVILGDMNAESGTDDVGGNRVVGPFGFGTLNDNSERLLAMCENHGLTVLGSWFRRLNIHRWSWLSHDRRTKKEIDHIIITRRSDRHFFKSYRVLRGAEAPANSDHLLVTAKMEIAPFKKPRSLRTQSHTMFSDYSTTLAYDNNTQWRSRTVSTFSERCQMIRKKTGSRCDQRSGKPLTQL